LGFEDRRHRLGLEGERLAEQFLRRSGLKPRARRFRTPAGELDLVMMDDATLVFVEVKTQTGAEYLDPHERVGSQKRLRLVRAARWYVTQHRLSGRPCRFDVVSIVRPKDGPPRIEHFPDAFAPENW
jgi:putative endonuclease